MPQRRQRAAAVCAALALILFSWCVVPPPTAGATPTAASITCSLPYLHTDGPTMRDACGNPVVLHALNWYGFDSNDFAVGGLADQSYHQIIDRIKALGYNALRLPFSNELVERNPVVSSLGAICAHGTCLPISGTTVLGPNSDLVGLDALHMLKAIVDYAGRQGLYVILDDHRSEAGWGPEENGLWYTAATCPTTAAPYTCYDPASWLHDWQTVATLFSGDPNVIGMDLRNEPHAQYKPSTCADYLSGTHWGSCGGQNNSVTDWAQAATTAGNLLLGVNPQWLIAVEGISSYPQSDGSYSPDGWGENLQGAESDPIVLSVPNRLIYAPHDYRWSQPTTTVSAMQSAWTRAFGFVAVPNHPYTAPLWLGEFGTCTHDNTCIADGSDGNSSGRWLSALLPYLATPPAPITGPLSWAYWPLNGTFSDSWSNSSGLWQTCYGQREDFGLLGGDWVTLSAPLLQNMLIPGSADPSTLPTQWPSFNGPLSAAQCTPSADAIAHATPTPRPPTVTPTATPSVTATATPSATATATPSSTPSASTTVTPSPIPSPTATPRSTVTVTPSVSATPSATGISLPTSIPTPRPTRHYPAHVSVQITLQRHSIAAGQLLLLRIQASARTRITVTLQVRLTVSWPATRGHRRTTHLAVLYSVTRQGTTGRDGRLESGIPITYRPQHDIQAVVSVIAQALHSAAHTTVTIMPPLSL